MYCPNCQCEFENWSDRCPICGTVLIDHVPSVPDEVLNPVSYQELVDLVNEHGGRLKMDLKTVGVGTERKKGFPYFGFKYVWAKRMQGAFNGITIDLVTTEVGKDREMRFPFMGYGYAWARSMQGTIGGNKVNLDAKRVAKKRKWGFPYKGYGFAWTEEFSGMCGEKLDAQLLITDAGMKSGWIFPYFGYGSAWADKGTLTLKIRE
ncbi:MAG: hypothetical protein GTO18_10895 [Anaerolineales bacterium]|nr:hypothetical protein [Anaerolineales bacterium]